MKRELSFSKAAAALASGLSFAVVMLFAGCAWDGKDSSVENSTNPSFEITDPGVETVAPVKKEAAEDVVLPKVYFTSDTTSVGLMAAYNALEKKPSATNKVAVKLHSGEGPNSNYLRPAFIKELVQLVNGTIVEANTAYGGNRATTALHKQVMIDRGFTAIAKTDILDEENSTSLPIPDGIRIKENFVGSHFTNYDFYVVLSHFKGHIMGGFGGAVKNISIGIASTKGKHWIHSAGKSSSDWQANKDRDAQEAFLESMAEAGKSIVDHLDGNIIFINVMSHISIDCDCFANPTKPAMHGIGILSSLDPIALDQACVDLVNKAPEAQKRTLVNRMTEQKAIKALEHGEAIGLGSKTYEFVDITDDGSTSIRTPIRLLPPTKRTDL